MSANPLTQKVIFFTLLAFCLLPFVTAPIALILGFAMVNIFGNPYQGKSNSAVKWLLKVAIVGLGFGMNFYSAVNAGKEGLIFTVLTIVIVLALGWIIGRLLKIHPKTAYLVSSGTAICGGSAIAAVSPIIDAEPKQISVALGTVFLLNAIALIIFPYIGHYFDLTQHQFGLWCAIAIHDTSSVVGAASTYGSEALETATTIKLGRALWIIPLSLITIFINRKSKSKINIPYFIALFIIAMLIATFFPQFEDLYEIVVFLAKKALIITLFLIGCGLSIEVIRSTGAKTLILGLLLWIIISAISLVTILQVWI